MATYTAISNGQIDQDSPITQPLMTALRDNPIAMAEGDSSAPKFATQAQADGTFLSDSTAEYPVFTNLDDFSGIEFHLVARATNERDAGIEYSTDNGSTFSSATVLGTVDGDASARLATFSGYFNFSDGVLVSIMADTATTATFLNTTVSGASNNINAIRFTNASASAGSIRMAAIIKPNGGIV